MTAFPVGFVPATGWINDPHGIVRVGDLWHLFFQAVPHAPRWEVGIEWGHATSPDLVTWTQHPSVLLPGDGDDGIWTGAVVALGSLTSSVRSRVVGALHGVSPASDRQGRGSGEVYAVAFYTSVTQPDLALGRVRVAVARDAALTVWEKGPVVVEPPSGLVMFRDPQVLPEGEGWRMYVGAGLADGRPAVLSFVSDDLLTWRQDAPLLVGPLGDPLLGAEWECPQLARVDGRDVLVLSAITTEPVAVLAAVGDVVDGRFEVESWTTIADHATAYAPSLFEGPDGEPRVVFWLKDHGSVEEGRLGAISVPLRMRVVAGAGGAPEVRCAP